MKVFISYARAGADRATAGLLARALESVGVKPLFDEGLAAGAYLGDTVSELIRSADVLALLLTKNSASSLWVNQEVGFARALRKPIIPIKLEEDVEAQGMLRGTRQFECSDWFAQGSLQRLKSDIDSAVSETNPLPDVIPTEKERTHRVIERLRSIHESLMADESLQLRLYERSALSIFSVAGEAPPKYDTDYWRLLCKQRSSMEKLVDHERVETRLHMWPATRMYDRQAMQSRVNTLTKWLEDSAHPKNLRVLVQRHDGPNTLAVENHFAFEGLRTTEGGEYMYTLEWRYPSPKIATCFVDFYGDAWNAPPEAAKAFKREAQRVLKSRRVPEPDKSIRRRPSEGKP